MRRHVVPDLDTAMTSSQIEQVCQVENEARGLAVAGRPAPTETSLSMAERRVVELIASRMDGRNEPITTGKAEVAMLLESIDKSDVAPLSETVTDRMMAALSTLAPTIAATAAEEREAHAELNAFRDRHGLQERRALYPSSLVKHFASLVVVGGLESLGSATMYMGASSAGVLGAVMLAVSISAVNIGLGVLTGMGWRMTLAPASLRGIHRFWSVPAIGLGTLMIGYLNLFAAHFREVAVMGSMSPETDSLVHLWNEPFAVSATSLGLVVFGVLCAALAAWKGFACTDRAPGYAKIWRDWETKVENKNDLKGVLEAQLETIRLNEIEERGASERAWVGMLKDAKRRHVGLSARIEKADAIDARERKAAAGAVQTFRRINQQVRTDGQVPGYFAQVIDWSEEIPVRSGRDLGAAIEAKAEALAAGETARALEMASAKQRLRRGRDGIETIIAMIVEARSKTDAVEAMDLGSVRAFLETDVAGSHVPFGAGERGGEADAGGMSSMMEAAE